MKKLVILFCVAFIPLNSVRADDQEIEALKKQVQELNERVAKLEAIIASMTGKGQAESRVEAQQVKARERMQIDRKVYNPQQLKEIETLYQVANKSWKSDEGKESLKKLNTKYDKANRTGCALLYLGQMSEGTEKEQYLNRAIADFGDCRYGDGVQVGPFARLILAGHFRTNGNPEKADELINQIKEQFPDAIDHRGQLLVESTGGQ